MFKTIRRTECIIKVIIMFKVTLLLMLLASAFLCGRQREKEVICGDLAFYYGDGGHKSETIKLRSCEE